MFRLSPRQVHLDFHTSEHIPGIAEDFDATSFAKTVKSAAISSMTVFARCHHGLLYYDSKAFPELVHPHLKNKNLLVEQVRALHAEGINAPVYITVQWDYHNATTHPEWLIRGRMGEHEGAPFTEAGFYQSLCVNTGYLDFLKAHTAEVMDLLGDALDGLFFDIVGIRPCLCSACRAEMQKNGVDMTDDEAVRGFAIMVLNRFKADMSAFVRARKKDASIFYNAGHVGPCTKASAGTYSHFELESLPSGGWGYLHFPVTARYTRKLGLDAMGMTGKFHTSWGDFHSLKNLAALEFEAFRMLSFGFACSIGDQLEPTGKLNEATYRLIGDVYRPFAEREAWARPSTPLVEVGVMTSETKRLEHSMPDTILGATQLLEELAIQFDILDDEMDLAPYKVIIVPDDFLATAEFQRKLDNYVSQGGRVLACYKGGLSEDGKYPQCYKADNAGDADKYPDFLIAEGPLGVGLEDGNEYVIYERGAKIVPAGAETIMSARAPYFSRTGEHFCSHRYTPSAHGAPYPAVSKGDGVILFSHPLFSQYRDNAPLWVKQLISNALDLLMPTRLVRHSGPSTMTVSLLNQPEKKRICAHILNYVPVRKSATIDIIEERTPIYNVRLDVSLPGVSKARLVPEDVPLDFKDGAVTVPVVDGYAIVEFS